jgi:hypothetical protein
MDRHAHRLSVHVMVDTCSSWSLEPGMLLDCWHPSDIGGDVFLAAKRDEIRAKRPFLPLRIISANGHSAVSVPAAIHLCEALSATACD